MIDTHGNVADGSGVFEMNGTIIIMRVKRLLSLLQLWRRLMSCLRRVWGVF